MYDLLLSADLMVADPDAAAELLARRLGVLTHSNWRQAFPTHAYIAHFLRVHKSLAVAPTRIELQGHVEITAPPADCFFPAYLRSLIAFQGPHRPIKTHATVLTTSDVDATLTLLQRRRVPFRIAPRVKVVIPPLARRSTSRPRKFRSSLLERLSRRRSTSRRAANVSHVTAVAEHCG